MSEMISLYAPEILHIDDNQATRFGANQAWYPKWIQRMSGCGPTTCSNLLWYLSRAEDACGALCPYDGSTRSGILRLMQDVWRYITPGMRGVNKTSMFVNGVTRYGMEHGIPVSCRVLDIPEKAGERPSAEAMMAFLQDAIADNLPVAFLNLSNGSVKNLEGWHWVTLIGVNPAELTAEMYDQGVRQTIDLGLWLETTTKGGGLIAVDPKQ